MSLYETAIELILSKDKLTKKIFLGAFARDELPKIIKYPSCFILNTDIRSKPGEHWLAIFFDKNKNCYFFDSFANSPTYFKLKSYLKRYSKDVYWNNLKIQGDSEFCGFYSILYLLFKVRGLDKEFFKQFSENSKSNDEMILNLIIKYL